MKLIHPFPIPPRLLVTGHRRGAIQAVETLEDLLDGPQRDITWKLELGNGLIILAGGPGGSSVREDVACASIAMTECLARRAPDTGYGPIIAVHWIRKETA